MKPPYAESDPLVHLCQHCLLHLAAVLQSWAFYIHHLPLVLPTGDAGDSTPEPSVGNAEALSLHAQLECPTQQAHIGCKSVALVYKSQELLAGRTHIPATGHRKPRNQESGQPAVFHFIFFSLIQFKSKQMEASPIQSSVLNRIGKQALRGNKFHGMGYNSAITVCLCVLQTFNYPSLLHDEPLLKLKRVSKAVWEVARGSAVQRK